MAMKLCLVAGCAAVAAVALDPRDLQRARQKVPRQGWKGPTVSKMSHVLNGHLKKMFPNTKPCSEWTAQELQDFQTVLHGHRHEGLDEIYAKTSDTRRLRFESLDAHLEAWKKANAVVDQHQDLKSMHRDGHCHEAVMWLVHQVPSADQHSVFSTSSVPMLSEGGRHSCDGLVDEKLEVCRAYEQQLSCSDCHSGTGITMQDYNLSHGIIPDDPKHPGLARQRRCDSNFLPACGPCEGIGGPYWGDSIMKFQPTNCELVSLPEDVPVADRPPPVFPEQMIVHQLGSDRLVRTQNAARIAFYSQIRSTLWYDMPSDKNNTVTNPDGQARLRHDSFYDDLGYKWMGNGLVSEIHLQTKEQRAANITGPMVSLLHGLLGLGKYLGGCTCVGDPVGVPTLGGKVMVNNVVHTGFLDGEYLGRIIIGVEYDGFKLGDKGHGNMKAKRNMTVDHYMKWFLHFFIDADKASPTYGQPVRFYGPYSGFAVYVSVNATVPPAEVWNTACVDNGWGEKPEKCQGNPLSKYHCMNVDKAHPEVCKPYENENEMVQSEIISV